MPARNHIRLSWASIAQVAWWARGGLPAEGNHARMLRVGLPATCPHEQITIAPDFAPAASQPAWRQDFPIDWPQDLYVERRDFLKFMVLTSAAFTLGQLWIGAQNWWRKRTGEALIQRVVSVDGLAVRGPCLHVPGRT